VGRQCAVTPNPTITKLASRLDRPVPGPRHRHAPEPAHATAAPVWGDVGRWPGGLDPPGPSDTVSRTEHLTTRAARATGRGSPHLQLMGSRDRRLRRRLRDSPGCCAPGATSASGVASASRLARLLRTGRDLSEREGFGLETRPDGSAVGRDLKRTDGRDFSDRTGVTSANGTASASRLPRVLPLGAISVSGGTRASFPKCPV